MVIEIAYAAADSPVGRVLLAHSDSGLAAAEFADGDIDSAKEELRKRLEKRFDEEVRLVEDADLLSEELDWMARYNSDPAGTMQFDGRFDFGGTPFQKRVYMQMLRIPPGETRTYKELAMALGRPAAGRAVGNACAANSIPIVVPCHRVVAQDGLGGYGGGLDKKRKLLTVEGVDLPE